MGRSSELAQLHACLCAGFMADELGVLQVVQPFMCFASIPIDRGLSCALQGGT